jgi:hypothetical protein
MRTPTPAPVARAAARAALLAVTLAALAGCEGTTSAVGPQQVEFAATTGGDALAGGRTSNALVGRWTRIEDDAAGLLVETTFTFVGDGTGTRTVVTRSVLGAVLAVDRAPFRWSGGGGVLVLRFAGPFGDAIVRATFAVETELAGTTLHLDGRRYRRTQ